MSAAQRFKRLTLTAGSSRLTLVPAAGGAVMGWRICDQPMFYETGIAAAAGWDPLATACFPLVPYSNRIGGGGFLWDGAAQKLRPNRPGFAHALHGVGWLREWAVTECCDAFAAVQYHHDSDADWPWPFLAEQRFALSPDGLTIDLAVTNLGAADAPLAIGIHPYFCAAGAHLQFAAEQIWQAGADQLPVRAVPPDPTNDFAAGRAVANTRLDNGYDSWDGCAAIWWDDRPMRLNIRSDMPCAVVYTPADAGFFCFEPVPHSNNALNLGKAGFAMPVAGPAETITARVAFEAWERL